MAKVIEKFVTPVGRLVGGSFFDMNTKDNNGRDLDPKKYNWWVGLAFPKTAANWWEEQGELGAVFQAILKAASSHYVAGETQQATFAWKITNGDDPKHATKTGYPGHWIIGFSRNVAIDACPLYNAQFQPVIDKNQAKKGYYYRISGSTSANEATGNQAGVYINMEMAQLLYAGEEIISGPAPASVFGAVPAMPAGATAIGATPAPVAAPVATPAPVAAPVATPAPVAAPVATPAPVAAPVATPAPVAAPVKVMTEKAAGATYEQFVAQGWTDQAMIDQGYMVMTTPAPGFLTGNGY
ncbi:ssDNA binding protein and ssDNA annealing protein [Klebsiella phage Kpn BU9]|nr:ssDNA binding protein and ssDNA annealing protein [Klebsiella phage Kpn BU9]